MTTAAARRIAEEQGAKDAELAATLGVKAATEDKPQPQTLAGMVFDFAAIVATINKTQRIAPAIGLKILEAALNYQLGIRSINAQQSIPQMLNQPEEDAA